MWALARRTWTCPSCCSRAAGTRVGSQQVSIKFSGFGSLGASALFLWGGQLCREAEGGRAWRGASAGPGTPHCVQGTLTGSLSAPRSSPRPTLPRPQAHRSWSAANTPQWSPEGLFMTCSGQDCPSAPSTGLRPAAAPGRPALPGLLLALPRATGFLVQTGLERLCLLVAGCQVTDRAPGVSGSSRRCL